jgi:uncharacterized protein YnzC (UPF0291/DUF896 family)
MTKKLTKKERFELLKTKYNLDAEDILFIDHEIELLTRKNGGEKSPTKRQVENEAIKQQILEGMQFGVKYQIKDLIKTIPALNDLTNQKVSALVRQMVEAEILEKVVENRKSFFLQI